MLPVVSDVHFVCFLPDHGMEAGATARQPATQAGPRVLAGRAGGRLSHPITCPNAEVHFVFFCFGEFLDHRVSCVYTRKKYMLSGTIG